jgi:hypothetical protein
MALQPIVGLGRFFSFLILHTVGRALWTDDQPNARPLPSHKTTHKQLYASSGIRAYKLRVRPWWRQFVPQTARPLWSPNKMQYLIKRQKVFSLENHLHFDMNTLLLLNIQNFSWKSCIEEQLNRLHGTEPFMRSRQLCSSSRTSYNFVESEGWLICSWEHTTGPVLSQSTPSQSI